jgi:hypothetical protein
MTLDRLGSKVPNAKATNDLFFAPLCAEENEQIKARALMTSICTKSAECRQCASNTVYAGDKLVLGTARPE